MQTFVACLDQQLLHRIESVLRHAGIRQVRLDSLAIESIAAATERSESAGPALLLMGSVQFSDRESHVIRDLVDFLGNRIKLVAVGPSIGPETLLEVIRAGAVDYLDASANFQEQFLRLLGRLRTSSPARPRVNKLIAVISPSEGGGGTFVAVNLAAAIASKADACCLLDFKLHGGDLPVVLRCSPQHTLLSLVKEAGHLDGTMFEQSLFRHECGVHLLPGPDFFTDATAIDWSVVPRVLDHSRAAFPYVVAELDTAHLDVTLQTLSSSDRVLVPFRPDFVSLFRTKKFLDLIERAKIPLERVVLVPNQGAHLMQLPPACIEETLGARAVHTIPDEPLLISASLNLGVPIVLSSGKSKVARSIHRLAETLMDPTDVPAKAANAVRGPWLAALRNPGAWLKRLGAAGDAAPADGPQLAIDGES